MNRENSDSAVSNPSVDVDQQKVEEHDELYNQLRSRENQGAVMASNKNISKQRSGCDSQSVKMVTGKGACTWVGLGQTLKRLSICNLEN